MVRAALLGAAAAGIAHWWALNAADTSRAILGIAATFGSGRSSYNNAVAGATTLNVAGGMSGFVLGLAPDLALAGFTAQDDAIEEALSGLVGDGFQLSAGLFLDQLAGTRWGDHAKLVSPARLLQSDLRSARCARGKLPSLTRGVLHAKAEDIERIDIATFHLFATVMAARKLQDPPNYFASKYSLPHGAACLAVRGSAGYEFLS